MFSAFDRSGRRPAGKPARTRLSVNSLEDRLMPSWGSTPPATITVPTSNFTQATLDTSGDATGTATISSTEIDWFKFTASATGTYVLDATTPSSSLDTVAAVYSSTGSRLGFNDDVTSGNTDSRVSVTLTAGQTYFLAITNYTGTSGGAYTWKIDGPAAATPTPTPTPTPGDDAYENNDTQAAAYSLGTLTSPRTVSGLQMQDSADWFSFTTTAAGTSTSQVSIAFTHSQGDIDLRLFNASGTQVGSSEGSGNSETISMSGLPAGTYYVQAFGYSGAKNPSYSLTITPPAAAPTPNPTPTTDAWTIFVYMTASDLHEFANQDINEMEKAAASLPSSVNIVVLWDQSSTLTKYATGNGSQAAWGTTGRAVIQADTNMSRVATTFDIIGEKNTGSATTLKDFLTWGAGVAPAQNYSLIMWNHGAGIYGSNYDDSDGGTMDFLSVSEVAGVLGSSGVPSISVMSYDACLMGMAEIGYAFKDKVQFFAASEELEAGTGQDYTTLFNVLQTNPGSVTPQQLAAGYVTSFGNQYVGTGVMEDTYSSTRASAYNAFASALKTFTDATLTASSTTRGYLRTARNAAITYDGESYKDFRDLGSFMAKVSADSRIPSAIRTAANGVISSLGNLVANKTADQRNSSGVAIYLPGNSYDSSYTSNFTSFNNATGWDKFAKWLATGTRTTTTGTASGARGPASRGVASFATDARSVSQSLLGYDSVEPAQTLRVGGVVENRESRHAEHREEHGRIGHRAAALFQAADAYLSGTASTGGNATVSTPSTTSTASHPIVTDDVLAG